MKYVITSLLICVCLTSFGQRLFLHHQPSGNYQSYDLGDKINLILFDSTHNIEGKITALRGDEIVVNDTSVVKISQIAGILEYKGGAKIGRVLLVIVGSYLVIVGTVYFIAGIVLLPSEPQFGVVGIVLGAGIGVGGFAIIKKQFKKMKSGNIKVKNIDNREYRLFIEN